MLKNWKLWLSLLISGVALFLALRDIQFDAFFAALSRANIVWLIPSFIIFLASLGLRAIRWSKLMGDTPFWTTFHAMNIGYLLNMVLPFRVGEVGRAYVMGERSTVSMTRAFSTIIVERVLDLASLVLIFAVFTQVIPLPQAFSSAALVGGAVAVLVMAVLAIMVYQADRAETVLTKILSRIPRIHPESWLRRFRDLCEGFSLVRNPRLLLTSLALTALIWVGMFGVAFFTMLAFYPASFLMSVSAVIASNLGGALPSAPGGLGVVQFFAQQSLALPFGMDISLATAFAFVWSLWQQLALILLGLFGLTRIGMSFSQTAGAARTEEGINKK
ncbi:MAG: lysylphosphatidylglycerol synthase transmembrane domain-containing protein [Anaerolineae bacterium]